MADITPCAAGTGGEHVGFVLCKQPPCGGNTTNSPWLSVYSQSPSYKAVISHPCLALEPALCSYLQHVRNSLHSLHSESRGWWTSQKVLTDIKGEPEETGKGNTFAALALSPSPNDSLLLTV